MDYRPNKNRYNEMTYNRCGDSGLLLPAFSLGLWHNFGQTDSFDNARTIVQKAFDAGITHFDLANNYGPPPGSAETTFGKILKSDLAQYRDEIIVSTKAGWKMWEGPYGDFGSKKYLVSSLDQSLQRMGLDYVDIYYHHRPDPNTPLEETMGALDLIVRQGKALYVGISSYNAVETKAALKILKEMGTPCLIHQPRYSMFDRWIEEDGLLDLLGNEGVGSIVFSPLEQGLLTNKYLHGIPESSRAASGRGNGALEADQITPEKLDIVARLNNVAKERGQSLAQMALSWVKRDPRVTSVLLGVSRPEQLEDSLRALQNPDFDQEELNTIENILSGKG
ncbi:L-glyceraldehyde 3-phosphate reductase [Flagellimonas halotolerans]|uniref:L-glyceraldehyde 3-phosphate reductase n=1 Tax=Flagellimonas halotolerans TaxID=3112164 RepID=A0ABU6ISY3_9FLAO|nr:MULTISPECIES: L-glyceraldehyde 3-phosphate reductase [unclassified Allomuricauda]MEC3966385.1 L-glyceraldehyde 3-phosphate reductase [Muricauda sp. SYSU M86414]MEC4266250.1 L-glyceraldehyde 3-phosphate reductase [Muricauda sp. SYSU M84420]